MKKTIFYCLTFLFVSFNSVELLAQTDTIKIVTSSVCSTCKKTIEHDLSFEKGVKSSILNVETRELTVVYDSKKSNPDKIRLAVTKIGYDADSLKADPKSFKRLPECCKDPVNHH